MIATPSEKRAQVERKKQQEQKLERLLAEVQAVADKISSSALKVGAKAGTSGKIFGRVTTIQLADALKAATGHDIDRKKVKIIDDEIKTLGTYKARIELHRDVVVDLEFEVVAE